MAYDHLIDKAAEEAQRASLADHIRAKAGTTEPLAWPSGFETAVDAIETGGGALVDVLLSGLGDPVDISSNTNVIRSYGLYYLKIHNLDLPECTRLELSALNQAEVTGRISLPKLEFAGQDAMGACFWEHPYYDLTLPSLTHAGYSAFGASVIKGTLTINRSAAKIPGMGGALRAEANAFSEASISTVIIGKLSSLGFRAFRTCGDLNTVIIESLMMDEAGSTSWPTLDVEVFKYTPIEKGTGYIYCPKKYVDGLKTQTNWSVYAAQIRAIEDYPEIVAKLAEGGSQ